MQKNFSISTKRKKERKIRVYQQLLVGPNAIFAKDKESEGVSYVNQKKEKGGLEGDQGGVINGKWMRQRRRREGGWEEREEDRKERRGGQKFSALTLLHIHYFY